MEGGKCIVLVLPNVAITSKSKTTNITLPFQEPNIILLIKLGVEDFIILITMLLSPSEAKRPILIVHRPTNYLRTRGISHLIYNLINILRFSI